MKPLTDIASGDWVIFKSLMLDGMLARPVRVNSTTAHKLVVVVSEYPGEPVEFKTKDRKRVAYAFASEAEAHTFHRAHMRLYRTMRAEADEAKHKFEGSVKLLVAGVLDQ